MSHNSNTILKEIIENADPNMLPHPKNEDRIVWSLTPTGFYSAKSTWEALRTAGLKVNWTRLVWHKK